MMFIRVTRHLSTYLPNTKGRNKKENSFGFPEGYFQREHRVL